MELLTHDRGLGSAYERYHFYGLIESWAKKYEIKTVLEGPIDGMAGIPGVHAVGLARAGLDVTALVPSDEQRNVTHAVYDRAARGKKFRVDVMPRIQDLEGLPQYDLVIAYHAMDGDWRAHLARVARRAKKLLVVTVCNPDNWGVAILRAASRVRGLDLAPPEPWRTDVLAPELWKLGRVREHAYFDCPWWPDLQVAPGQSLLDRAKKLVSDRGMRFTATIPEAKLAAKFVYGPEQWPYFGEDGFEDELRPALERHPAFEHSRHALLKKLAGHLHAFAVDMTPRTETARRRMQLKR